MRPKALLLLLALVAVLSPTPSPGAQTAQFCPQAVRWQDAENYVGQRRNVEGTVKSTFYARGSSGRPTFIDLGRPFPSDERFTVVIWWRDRSEFHPPPERLYRREHICVTGRIRLYRELPQTTVNDPSDIDIRGEP
jgi:hypothetical protein